MQECPTKHKLLGAARRSLSVGLLGAAVALLGACGASDQPAGRPAVTEAYGHVHGVGVNPADESLFLATHTGLFRAPKGQATVTRVGRSHQDTMGFTVVSENTFLGSGHPDAREDKPPHLGLIVSDDAGRSWRELGLSGQADLHVIRVGSRRTYAFDSLSGSLLVSDDSASSWRVGKPPGPLVDLALDPRDERHLIAATEEGLVRSRDGGADWRPLRGVPTGFLAWQRSDVRTLLAVGSDGTVRTSRDAGRSWRRVGDVGGEPTAATNHGDDFYAATSDGAVHVSSDGGRTWRVRVEPSE
jgi:photosystem II stability/assembly factor-like uncharacterized protein